jgi:hypothetical protein
MLSWMAKYVFTSEIAGEHSMENLLAPTYSYASHR